MKFIHRPNILLRLMIPNSHSLQFHYLQWRTRLCLRWKKIWLSVDTCHLRFSMTHPDPAIVVSQDIFRISSEKIKGLSRFLFERESPGGACTKVTLGLQTSAINQRATIPRMRLRASSQRRERVYREGWECPPTREECRNCSTLPSPNTKWLLTEPRKIDVS